MSGNKRSGRQAKYAYDRPVKKERKNEYFGCASMNKKDKKNYRNLLKRLGEPQSKEWQRRSNGKTQKIIETC